MSELLIPGQSLAGAISAHAWNRNVESRREYFKNNGGGSVTLPQYAAPVKIKNLVGRALYSGEVVEFDGYVLDDDEIDQEAFWLKGVTPTLRNAGFGILSLPINDGEIGPVVTSGTYKAIVNVRNIDHQYAELVSGETKLRSSESGPVRLDYAPSEGEVKCIVTIGQSASKPATQSPQYDFTSTTRTRAARTSDVYYNGDTCEVILAHQVSGFGSSYGYLTSLELQPRQALSAVSASVAITTQLNDGDTLQLRCGAGQWSLAGLDVTQCGINVRFLAPAGDNALLNPLVRGTTFGGYAPIGGYQNTGYLQPNWQVPYVIAGDNLTVQIPGKTPWLAEITFFAVVDKLQTETFAKIIGGLSESSDDGDPLLTLGVSGFFEAIPQQWNGSAWVDTQDRCWVTFNGGPIRDPEFIAELGLVYGPLTFVGTGTFDGVTAPLLAAPYPVEEEWEATASGDTAKGDTGDFILLNGDGSEGLPPLTVQAEARWNKCNSGKKCIVKRLNGTLVANPVEC